MTRRPAARPVVIIFVKEPKAGRVKTRLAVDLGAVGAAWWQRHQTNRLLRRLTRDPRWTCRLAATPDAARSGRCWPSGVARAGQGRGDLGRRMLRALATAPGPAVLIGSDIPDVAPHHIATALWRLGGAEAVLGPAKDGGFWLIGRAPGRAWPLDLFDGVRWSTEFALADTVARLGPRRVAFADCLRDVDCVADLRAGQ